MGKSSAYSGGDHPLRWSLLNKPFQRHYTLHFIARKVNIVVRKTQWCLFPCTNLFKQQDFCRLDGWLDSWLVGWLVGWLVFSLDVQQLFATVLGKKINLPIHSIRVVTRSCLLNNGFIPT